LTKRNSFETKKFVLDFELSFALNTLAYRNRF